MEGLGIGKQVLIKKILNFFPAVNFFQFLVIKTPGSGLDSDPDRYLIQPKMLDLDPDQKNRYGSETLHCRSSFPAKKSTTSYRYPVTRCKHLTQQE
jgi:hypothetical protein